MRRVGALLLMGAAGCAMVCAQYGTGFEPPITGSATGTVLTGQDGYYIPAGTTSVDFKVYTYQGNTVGMPPNPNGGTQFIAGTGPGVSSTYARAQRDITWPSGVVTVGYDAGAAFLGTPPKAQNLGSFSAQPGLSASLATWIHLFSWEDPNSTVLDWQALYLAYDAAGTQAPQPGLDPGAAWNNLSLNNWYHFETVVDFDANRILEVSIQDITGGGPKYTHTPANWYLAGGAGGHPPTTGFRFFGGGNVPGNTTAWDNLSIPEPATLALLGLIGALRRR